MSSQTPTPETINRLRNAVYPSYALLAGVQLGVFTALKDGAKTAKQIAENLGVHAGKLDVLLCALVPTGLLEKEGDAFSNSAEADSFLVRGLPGYLGGAYENTASDRWIPVLKTADSIRSGTAQAKVDYSNATEEELIAHFQMFSTRRRPAAETWPRVSTSRTDGGCWTSPGALAACRWRSQRQIRI